MGYISFCISLFVGNLEHTIWSAYRLPNTHGGEDVILANELPCRCVWWGQTIGAPSTSVVQGTLIQLQLNKDGRGEGKLS